jgi:flavin reductase (DIM6/NTAB) family NADH-FMN oxidoreductase RutF
MIELENVKNYLGPLPVILVTTGIEENKTRKDNIIPISWTGIIENSPHLISINIAKGKYSGSIIKITKEFGLCIPTAKHIKEIDICGCTHGNKVDKFELSKFTRFEASSINAPLIMECPINMECVLEDIIPFESHEMFIGRIIKTHADESCLDEKGKADFGKIDILAYLNYEYWTLGRKLENLFFTRKK